MANYPRTEAGFNSAINSVMMHTKMHTRPIYLYVPPGGNEYIVSIIHPGDRIAEYTAVAEYGPESFTEDDHINRAYVAMQDAPDQVAAGA